MYLLLSFNRVLAVAFVDFFELCAHFFEVFLVFTLHLANCCFQIRESTRLLAQLKLKLIDVSGLGVNERLHFMDNSFVRVVHLHQVLVGVDAVFI